MNSIENEKLQQMNTPNGGYRLKEAVKAMINYGSPILVQFPRVEKYGLAKRIRETMYDMLHLCNVIQKKYYKRDTLREFDIIKKERGEQNNDNQSIFLCEGREQSTEQEFQCEGVPV